MGKTRRISANAGGAERATGRRGGLRDEHYQRLAGFRHALRRFLRSSESACRKAGISPTQYQLLLFVRESPGGRPAVADLAERLQVRHQSVVGLIDRCARNGIVRRKRDARDGRVVRLQLTPTGHRLLARLVFEHYRGLAELRKAIPWPLPFPLPPGG